VNYTWSKSLDNIPLGEDAVTPAVSTVFTMPPTTPNYQMLDRGPSDFNHTSVHLTSKLGAAFRLRKLLLKMGQIFLFFAAPLSLRSQPELTSHAPSPGTDRLAAIGAPQWDANLLFL
jgi:hypothetical protein